MTAPTNVLRELAGLFVDDGALALTIMVVIIFAGLVAILIPDAPLAAGVILLVGCLAALVWSVRKAGQC